MIVYNRPEKTNVVTNEVVRWQSMRQPYIFTFYRQDTYYSFTYESAGFFAFLTTQVVGFTPAVGDEVTLVNNSQGKKITGKISVVESGSGSTWKLRTDVPFDTTFDTDAGYINWGFRENYKIWMRITAYIPSLNEVVLLGELKGTPDSYGVCKIDVRELLTSYIEKVNKYNFSYSTTEREYSGWCSFTFEWKDSFVYEGELNTTVKGYQPDPYTYYAVDGAKYLLSIYGQNFADYAVPTQVAFPAKLLTSFSEAKYFYPYPFSVSFMLSEGYENYSLQAALSDNVGTLNIPINTGLGAGLYQIAPVATGSAQYKDFTLENFGVQAVSYMPTGYVQSGYVLEQSAIPVSPFAVSENLRINIDSDCRVEPIYLMWKNSVGGWDFWLFDKKYEVSFNATQGSSYEVYSEDIATATMREKITEARQFKTITMGDVVEKKYLSGLIEIERSPQVYALYDSTMLPANPELAWIGVRVAPKGFKYKIDSNAIEVEVSIVYPELYSIPN